MENITRNKAHEFVMQTLYSYLIYEKCEREFNIVDEIELIFGLDYNEIDVYVRELILACLKHVDEARDNISKNLQNWAFNRLNYCVQAILIMAYTEYFYVKDSDKAIVINIAIKLAKKYADSNDYRFINGVLDNTLNGK